ncbi:hypothetical protein CIPAW_02G109000 [Carya illinoinensis]|uniref:Uncharacterized protein n=1 Tax=Carya illinoinensis TaxID=32201 RepID=A0A8T1RF30_CARIL|nr:hypothetical protein CIPAW_02G109000 [Carya illinoinensis]
MPMLCKHEKLGRLSRFLMCIVLISRKESQ